MKKDGRRFGCVMLLLCFIVLVATHATARAATYRTLYVFQGGTDGAVPNGVAYATNGTLYGTTYYGGDIVSCPNGGRPPMGCGTAFQLTPVSGAPWSKTTLLEFFGDGGAFPVSKLVFGSTGALYGTTVEGGPGVHGGGTVFQLTPPSTAGEAWTDTALYGLPGGDTAPNSPIGQVLITSGGVVYGTAYSDSFSCCYLATGGTVFQLKAPSTPGGVWTEDTIADFALNTSVGDLPAAGLVGQGGALYGTNTNGGYCGTVFGLTPPATPNGTWTTTLIHGFQGSDGCGLLSNLIAGPEGTLYGTTAGGGSTGCLDYYSQEAGCGTVFQLTPPAVSGGAWTENVLYAFTGTNGDGAYPTGSVLLGKNGVLYGSTSYGGLAGPGCIARVGGAKGCGTVF